MILYKILSVFTFSVSYVVVVLIIRDFAMDTSGVFWHGLACIRQAFYHPDLDLTLRLEQIQRI